MFWAPCGSGGGGGWVYGGGGWFGVAPHTCAHACKCKHTNAHAHAHGKHDYFMQMAAPIGGIPGNSLWCHMSVCMHACTCVCTCVGALSDHPPPTSTHPPPPRGGTPGINQNSIALELIRNFNSVWRFEICGDFPTHGWVYGSVGGWLGWWMGSGQNTKNLKIVDWIKIIQFCLKIYLF